MKINIFCNLCRISSFDVESSSNNDTKALTTIDVECEETHSTKTCASTGSCDYEEGDTICVENETLKVLHKPGESVTEADIFERTFRDEPSPVPSKSNSISNR